MVAPVRATGGLPGKDPNAIAQLAKLAKEMDSVTEQKRARAARTRVLKVLFGTLTVVGMAVLMAPWLRSMQALSLFGSMGKKGAASMGASGAAAEAELNSEPGSAPQTQSDGPPAGDGAAALAARGAGGLSAPADDKLPTKAPEPAAPKTAAAQPQTNTTGTLATGNLGDLAKRKAAQRSSLPGAAAAAAAAPANARAAPHQAKAAADETPSWTLWLARASGFVAGLLIAWIAGKATGWLQARRKTQRASWALRVLPNATMALVAGGLLAWQFGPALVKQISAQFAPMPKMAAPAAPKAAPGAGSAAPSKGNPPAAPKPQAGAPVTPPTVDSTAATALIAQPSPTATPSSAKGAADASKSGSTAKGAKADGPAATKAATKAPANFAELVTRLRAQHSPPQPARPFTKLRAALRAKHGKPTDVARAGAERPEGEAPAAGAPPPAMPRLGLPSSMPGPMGAIVAAPPDLRDAALRGLLVGLLAGSGLVVLSRLGGRGAGAFVLLVLVGLPSGARAADGYGQAVAAKFVSCYQAEGATVTPEDQADFDAASEDFAGLRPTGSDGANCADPAATSSCIASVQSESCEDFANDLSKAMGVSTEEPAPPAWAATFGSAVGDKMLQCVATESGAAPAESDASMIHDYGNDVAKLLAMMTSTGTCKPVESALGPCTDSIRASTCDAALTTLGATIQAPPEPPPAPEGGAEAPPHDYAADEAAAEADAPALTDEELDAQIDAAAANTKSAIPFFEGACAQLLDCGQAAADENAP